MPPHHLNQIFGQKNLKGDTCIYWDTNGTANGNTCTALLKNPSFFHSDGHTRAGVYCAANACIEQVIQHGEVDVFQAVKTVRRHRPQLVENIVSLHLWFFLFNILRFRGFHYIEFIPCSTYFWILRAKYIHTILDYVLLRKHTNFVPKPSLH